jgi:hypothetical protein
MIKLNLLKRKPKIVPTKEMSVYKSIVDEKTGRRKRDISSDRGIREDIENWDFRGNTKSIESKKIAEVLPPFEIDSQLIRKRFMKRQPVDMMILGAGEGIEANIFSEKLKGMKLNIDTLGLTQMLDSKAKQLIRNDYSPKKAKSIDFFEHFNHLKLVEKYDYIFSDYGPGFHTLYPEIVLLKVGSMLKRGGFATIGINDALYEKISGKIIINNINEYLKNKKLSNRLRLTCIKLKNDSATYIRIERLK